MQASQTQIDAFYSLTRGELSASKQKIVDAFGSDTAVTLTRDEISARTDLKVSTVCGRVNELVEAGVLAVRGTAKRPGHRCAQQLVGLPVSVN